MKLIDIWFYYLGIIIVLGLIVKSGIGIGFIVNLVIEFAYVHESNVHYGSWLDWLYFKGLVIITQI